MHVRQREEELGAPGVPVVGPRGAEVLDPEAERVDDGLVLGAVDRADRVDDRPARAYALDRGPQEGKLQVGQRLRAPAEIGARV